MDRLRARWHERAGEQRLFHINADCADWTDQDFLASGEQDVAREVDPHLGHLPEPAAGAVALDVGCGVGRLSRALARRFARVEAVDIAAPMVAEASRFAPPVPTNVHYQVCVGDGSLPLEDASVHFAFSYLVYQHLPDAALVQASIDEIGRVLVPGGIARLQVNGVRRSVAERLSIGVVDSERVPLVHRKPRLKLDPHSHMGVTFTERAARALGAQAGLEVLDVTGVGEQHLWLLLRRPARVHPR